MLISVRKTLSSLFVKLLVLLLFSAISIELVEPAGAVESNNSSPDADESAVEYSENYPYGEILPELLPFGYSGNEKLSYDVSWSGGVKIGELHLQMNKLEDVAGAYEIRADVSTKKGDIHLFYPVSDKFVTKVKGPKMLPYHYDVRQKEGYRYRAHRVTTYDQEKWTVQQIKNDKPNGDWVVDGVVNNEFSSFFNSRLMDFEIGKPFIVPTFADKKREEVAVHPIGIKEITGTVIGDVETVAIMPVMKFKGLYDKKGDTVIWYTNDECRVPVLIKSKIVIGSLVAKLTGYENTACKRYKMIDKKNKK